MSDTTLERYTIISVDGHAGADLARLQAVPRVALARRVRRVGGRVREPVRRPARADRVPQLGQRAPPRGSRRRRRRRRGAVPEHDPAVLRPGQPHRAASRPTQDYDRRWAGLQAHNRWLADFCAAAPGPPRRVVADLPQRRRRRGRRGARDRREHMRRVRRRPAADGVAELGPRTRCGTRTTSRSGSCARSSTSRSTSTAGAGIPDFGDARAGAGHHAHRARRGSRTGRCGTSSSAACSTATRTCASCSPSRALAWVPRGLDTLDWFYRRMTTAVRPRPCSSVRSPSRCRCTPSEYFQRNCWVGASFLRPSEAPLRHEVGVDRIMWGADYPHTEGTYPYTTEALRCAFARPAARRRAARWSAATRPRSTASTSTRCARSATASARASTTSPNRSHPSDYPTDSTCNAFEREPALKAW